jgi:hypothetical protein
MSKLVPLYNGGLTPAQVAHLADVPPELEWLANITNDKTRRAYKIDWVNFPSSSDSKSRKSFGRSTGRM